VGGLIGAVVYSLLMWGVFFQATPRIVAWLGQRQASAAQSAAPQKQAPQTPAPSPVAPPLAP